MKNLAFVIAFFLFSFSCFSEGIKFEQGTWSDILAIAKKTNKPVFVDIYTTWCGPCKKMSKEVFTLESVGKVYNENFVCYMIDAEKGEGVEIAKKYKVTAYPTYLFIKADGTLFSRALGSMEFSKFIEVSKTALLDLNDPKPIKDWDKEYPQKKNDPQFLLDYMNKRTKFGLPNITMFNEYLQLIPETERTSDQVVKLYQKESKRMKVSDFAFQNLSKNREAYLPKLFGYVWVFLQDGVINTMKEAAQSNNEVLLETAISAFKQIPTNPALKSKEEIYMDYYKITKEVNKYMKYATLFCNDNLMMITHDSINKNDKAALQLFYKQKEMGVFSTIDSTQLAQIKSSMEHSERDHVCGKFNDISWYIFEKVSDINSLKDALRWSDRTLELDPNNSMWMDTNANLLYKLGRKEEAINKEKEAIKLYINKDDKSLKGFEETLRKMESGEKTWK